MLNKYARLLLLSLCGIWDDSQAESWEDAIRIEITGQPPEHLTSLSKIVPNQQVLDETNFTSDSIATLLADAPAINFNGQGGLFQSINIRGFSRWRILTQIEGVPIHTERRAGTAAEFVPPSFVSGAYLAAGAASTQLGSGAIGGGIDLQLLTPQLTSMQLNYGMNNDYRDIFFSGLLFTDNSQEHSLSWMANHRHANNSEDAKNSPILDRFEQHSLALRFTPSDTQLREGMLFYSAANNVAKASADEQDTRNTIYPENNHLLGKFTFNWRNTTFYFHQTQFATQITRPGVRINQLRNESLDFGIQANDQLSMDYWSLYWRVGLDARTGVKVSEAEMSLSDNAVFDRHNVDANQWESFVAFETNRSTNNGAFVSGFRLAHQTQKDSLSGKSSRDQNASGFIGYRYDMNAHWQLSAYLSHAYRVPSLTERYYDGTTPRGRVIGDPELKTESALNKELNLAYKRSQTSFSVAVFQQDIDDYIERLNINDTLRQYRNLQSAQISGINYQGQLAFDWENAQWRVKFGGQWLDGEDRSGSQIADISPAQHRLSLNLSTTHGNGFIALTHRQSSSHDVAGEIATDSVNKIDLGYRHVLSDRLTLALNLNNVTDANYRVSRDDLAPFARGRDLTVSVLYEL